MSDVLDAAKKLVDTVEFDCNGVNGKGGNGGLLSDATIKAAGALRIALSRAESQPSRQAETSVKPSPGNQAITGETARGEPCDLPPPIHPDPSPVDRRVGSDTPEISQAAAEVLLERSRQISAEGWIPQHDDGYRNGEMAWAATCYLQNSAVAAKMQGMGVLTAEQSDERGRSVPTPQVWPWTKKWWKPAGQRRDLIKAAALIIAEIERLDRATPTSNEGKAQ